MESIIFGAKWLGVIIFIITIIMEISDFGGVFEAIFFVIKSTVVGIVVGVVLGLVMAIILSLYVFVKNDVTRTVEPFYPRIENLQDNPSTKGQFYFGSGNINGSMKYAFYIKEKDTLTGNKSFHLVLLDYKDVSIVYTDGQPRVDAVVIHRKETWQFKYSFLKETEVDRYIIHVPRGTIKNNYQLDAQ